MVPENVDRKDDGRSGGKDRRPRSGDRRDYRGNRDRHGPGNGRKDFRRDDRRGGGGRPRDGKGRGPGNGRGGAGNRPGQRPSNRTGRDGRPSDRRPRDDRRKPEGIPEHKPRDAPEPSLTIPSTPQRILFKGVDCEVNGRTDLAMILYLHGAAMLSKGCENNMTRMLREAGPEQFRTIRGRVAKVCPENAMIAFDYMCYTLDPGYDRSLLDSAAENGNPLAIYERIRLEEIGGDDPCIDAFAASDDERMVEDGLKLLVRKKDSVKAEKLLKEMEERRRQRQSVRVEFIRAMKDDRSSIRRLEELSSKFPEAGFLRGYLDAEDRESYIRDGMPRFEETVMSVIHELGISETPYGRYLTALKLRADGEEWIPSMINAAVAGSEDAVGELMPVQNRKDVRKGLASAYLRRNDAAGLVRCYDGEDTSFLDRYCAGDPDRVIEVGRLMGGSRQVEWIKRGCIDGIDGCRSELISMAKSGEHNNKQMVYALHDVGEDLESARMYFSMYGDRSLPAVKWLAKVCADEQAKEYVRSRFEEMGDLKTFDSIFIDDGYESRDRRGRKGGRGSGNRKGPGRR